MSWISSLFEQKCHSDACKELGTDYIDQKFEFEVFHETCSKNRLQNRILYHHNTVLEDVPPICNTEKASLPHFVAGVGAGVAEWFVGHPLDTIRVRIMAGSINGGSHSGGTLSQLRIGFGSWNGIVSLYRGSASELAACALGGSLLFGVNNILKRIFCVSPDEEGLSRGLILAAAGTGIVDSTIYKPLEIIKLRQQVSLTNITFMQTTRDLLAESGIRGMYRGLLPSVIREAIGSAAFFAAYELSKENICKATGQSTREANSQTILVSGGVAGVAYVLIAHPWETAAVLLQLDNYHNPKYRGLMDVFNKVVARAGLFRGLYTGVSPALLRAFPSYAAAFLGYEYTLKLIEDMSGARERRNNWKKFEID